MPNYHLPDNVELLLLPSDNDLVVFIMDVFINPMGDTCLALKF